MDIIGKGRILGAVSAVVVVISIALVITPGLALGIDFESGTSITYRILGEDPGTDALREAISSTGHDEAIVQGLGGGEYFVRLSELPVGEKSDIDEAIRELTGADPVTLDTATVGRSVADDTVRNSVAAVIIASLFVMLYIMYAFRTVPHSYRYALAAVVALGHDVLVTLGVFVLLGQFASAEVNAIFIVGILTVIGYSVNDTIVVFDRIRENVQLAPNRPFRSTVNLSINESVMRSLATSFTTATVLLAMLLFGGETLRDFVIVLFLGVIVGTYSSIFIAANVLVAWNDGALGRVAGIPFRPLRRFRREADST